MKSEHCRASSSCSSGRPTPAIRDWRIRLESLKSFTEGLTPYNTVGKLKNLRIGSDDIDGQKKNLEVLAAVEKLLELVTELGSTAAYLSQAEMVLSSDHPWVKQAQSTRKDILDKLAQDCDVHHAAEYRQTLAQLKKDYLTAYIAQHSKARLADQNRPFVAVTVQVRIGTPVIQLLVKNVGRSANLQTASQARRPKFARPVRLL